MKNNDAQAIDYIKSLKPRSKSHRIISRSEFMDGSISKVSFNHEEKDIDLWVIFTKNQKSHADDESQLIQSINTSIKQENKKFSFVKSLMNLSGLIALIIVIAVIYITINNPSNDVPEFLKTAMLTILGFYFGGLVVGKKSESVSTE